ncbi:MAG: twin-arginine translocase subunit TatC [Candidatus Hydrogenedentota bacterium]
MNQELKEMSFLGHLEELRTRILKILVVLLIVFILLYSFFREQLLKIIFYPLTTFGLNLVSLSPAEAFLYNFKICLYTALIISCPHWLYEIWQFIAAGLYKREKKVVLPCLIGMIVMFYTGVIFSFKYVLPFVINFFLKEHRNFLVPNWSYKFYTDFSLKLFLAFGLGFELPWVLFFLAKMGVVTYKQLLNKFRYAIVLIFIIAAVLTPPDIISQIFLAIPLIFLYLLGIFLARLVYHGRKE